jgi:transposase
MAGRSSTLGLHFTPTSGSWLNAVENFFSTLTRRAIRRGVFKSLTDLQETIRLHPTTERRPEPFPPDKVRRHHPRKAQATA